MPHRFLPAVAVAALIMSAAAVASSDDAYAPPTGLGGHAIEVVRETWVDATRQRREVPVLIYLPGGLEELAPVVVFSHGLGGSREGYEYLGRFWASHGYVSVHIQHAGSDDAVWRDAPKGERMKALATAASSPTVALHRAKDLPFALDRLTELNTDEASALHGRLDLTRIAVAGHSFGAWSALVVGGQRIVSPSGRAMRITDQRVKAILPLSAPVPRGERQRMLAYTEVRVPALHMTATLDDSPIGGTAPEDRRIPFDSAPAPDDGGADSYLITFTGGDHMTFAGTPKRRLDPVQRDNDAAFHPMIQRITLAFLDAYLRGDERAERWLQDGGLAKAVGEHAKVEMKAD